jgi:plastocyanin
MNARLLAIATATTAVLGGHASAALADEQIQAAPTNRYTTPAPTMDQGERLTFMNADLAAHDVTATQNGPDGKALFASPLIGSGQTAFVEGSQYLVTGSYDFICSVHPFMVGKLTVTGAGTPVPRPGGGGTTADTTAPSVRLRVKSARVKRFVVAVALDEAARVALKATARVGGRTVTVARGSAGYEGAGTYDVSMKVTRAGTRALKGRRSLKVSVRGTARDAAGNTRAAKASARLRR